MWGRATDESGLLRGWSLAVKILTSPAGLVMPNGFQVSHQMAQAVGLEVLALDGYLVGLRDASWQGDPTQVTLANRTNAGQTCISA